jgi:cell division protein FtsW (lipid II flippase)
MSLAFEILALVATVVLAWLGSDAAVTHALAKGAAISAPETRTAAAVQAQALQGVLVFAAGVAALIVGRVLSARRGRVNVPAHLVLPAMCAAAAMGLALQMGYGDPLHWQFWPGPEFARGFALAAFIGTVLLVLPVDPVGLTRPFHAVLPFLMVAVFVALAVFGSGTELAEDTLINLGGFQPLELVKLAFVLYLGHSLGSRAAKLRHQRDRMLGLDFPRKKLLVPAVMVLLILFGSFILVNDLGPLLILSIVFLALFYVATRAGGWVVLAVVVVVGFVWLAVQVPAISGSPKVALRMAMWLDPWTNALPNGDQGALARWAIAAGSVRGQGLGWSPSFALPAGHTDLVIAHLTEEMGAIGLVLYLVCIAAIAGQGLIVAALNRTPERAVTAAGLSVLLVAQWMVIFAGTTSLLPLTGVPAPYLSFGKTSMVVFVLVGAMIVRLAEDGRARELTSELGELRRGNLVVLAAALGVVAAGATVGVAESVVMADETSVRGAITHLAPEPGYPRGRVVEKYDPRLEQIARRIPRGPFVDREGRLVAGVDEAGQRTYPLGDAMGTLLGPPDAIVLRPLWMLERLLASKVRGYPEREDGHALWVAREKEGGERLLFIAHSHDEKPEDRARAEAEAGGAEVRLLPLPSPDYRPLLPILRAGGSRRDAAIAEFASDVERRTAHLTIDARLQKQGAEIIRRHAVKGTVDSGAAVVIDVNTGQVLARVQWPDFDPGDPSVRRKISDPEFPNNDRKWAGYYGAWPDKTGFRGIYQGGSAAKVFTALVAARAGTLGGGGGVCPLKAGPTYGCLHHDGQGPFFTRPGWYKAVHDHPLDPTHGHIDFVRGMAVSCNVYFGQLGLDLGADAFKQLVKDGVEMGWPGWYEPGRPGSRDLALTAFGQHASMMSVSQASRLVATVGSGGVYRRCPPSLELGAPCEEKVVVKDPNAMVPVLAGMEQVMLTGTGRGLLAGLPPGLRVYGKTGTADMIGNEEEKPWGVEKGVYGKPIAWFVAVVEPVTNGASCQPRGQKRLGFSVVVPRSGMGAVFAGPAASELIASAYKLGYFGDPKALEQAAQGVAPVQPAPQPPATNPQSPPPAGSPITLPPVAPRPPPEQGTPPPRPAASPTPSPTGSPG